MVTTKYMAFFLLSLSDKGKLNLIKLHHTTVGFLFAKREREKSHAASLILLGWGGLGGGPGRRGERGVWRERGRVLRLIVLVANAGIC